MESNESVSVHATEPHSSNLPETTAGNPGLRRTWKIYRIGCVRSGRGYVGVTRRTVEQRVVAHDLLARLRPHLGGPGTLAEAIRCAYEQGCSFETAFVVSRLAETDDPIEARCWERDWIARLGTAAPAGFNIMPGGSSLGGPANAESITVRHPGRGSLRYASVMAAVADLNAERKADGAVPLRLGVVYARLKLGWAAEEALGLAVHSDARRSRPAFLWHGHAYNTLRELADAEGLPIDTIRSRLHRAKRAGCGSDHDVSHDRRSTGLPRRDPRTGRRVRLFLPHPTDRAAVVDVTEFSRLTGVPKATVVHRYQRLRTRLSDDATLPHEEILASLVFPDDRRVVVALRLPNGTMLGGGVRSLIRQVFARRAVADRRVEKIGASAIRARLRRLPGWPDDLRPDGIAWAFGFGPISGADTDTGLVEARPPGSPRSSGAAIDPPGLSRSRPSERDIALALRRMSSPLSFSPNEASENAPVSSVRSARSRPSRGQR